MHKYHIKHLGRECALEKLAGITLAIGIGIFIATGLIAAVIY